MREEVGEGGRRHEGVGKEGVLKRFGQDLNRFYYSSLVMENMYKEIIAFMVSSGKRIVARAGKIKDIGIKKKYLTEEDIAIERSLKELIQKHYPHHALFAEEENELFPEAQDVWVVDPISGTRTFIAGLPHYGIVVAHTKNNIVQFGAVYDPSVDELFVAYKGKGAFLNGNRISISQKSSTIIFNLSSHWKDEKSSHEMLLKLSSFKLIRNKNSHAVNLCHVASGRADGVICFGKDSFPCFAGGLIIQEAGGMFTNKEGEPHIHPEDRIFIGGNKKTYPQLWKIVQQVKFFPPNP